MSEVNDMLSALTAVKQQLGTSLQRAVFNAGIIKEAPHGSGCPMHRTSRWHRPVVIDGTTRTPRAAQESDCDCWKSLLIQDSELEYGRVELPNRCLYRAVVRVVPVYESRQHLFHDLCESAGFHLNETSGSTSSCIGESNSYTELIYKTLTLIGELKLQKFRVLEYSLVHELYTAIL